MSRLSRSVSAVSCLGLLALVVLIAGSSAAPSPLPRPSPSPVAVASPAEASASPTVAPTPTPTVIPPIPVVPVAGFRTAATSIGWMDVVAVLGGTNPSFKELELVAADADGILGYLGLEATSSGHLRWAPTADVLAADLRADASRLGFVRASEVGPSIRALGWEGRFLFGVKRVRSLADWPLGVPLAASEGTGPFDLARTWTIVAAGDVMLDRGVYNAVVNGRRGVNYPFSGGTAAITSRYCCSSFGWALPRTRRVDTALAVRNLLAGADLSMLNLEGPAPVKSTYHPEGMSFTFDQALLAGLQWSGIDVVSLANNHIGNAGRQGELDTMAALDRLGIAHAGLGATMAEARTPAVFTVDGVQVAVLAYDAFGGSYGAGPTNPGSAQLSWGTYPDDIRAARAAGAQVVVVYPHWGDEYGTGPRSGQRTWAHAMIDAGADLVIGNHAHWAGAMEVYKGKPIWYALGNFIFDQTWSEQTEEGILLELTFSGPTLVQARLLPTVILDACQPNLLDPAGSGKVVLDQVYNGSKRLPAW